MQAEVSEPLAQPRRSSQPASSLFELKLKNVTVAVHTASPETKSFRHMIPLTPKVLSYLHALSHGLCR